MFLRRHILKYIKFVPFLILLYYEFIAYVLLPWHWPSMPTCSAPNCIKILLVADPQILGKLDSNWVARRDVDQFLKTTFQMAIRHVEPDIIVFLGDLMDEGHIASKEQFQSDLERFVDIFSIPNEMNCERIYIPGDNDIGGEGDPILPHIVARFNDMFEPVNEPISYLNLEFYKVNKMTQVFQEPEAISADYTRIAISHIPILRKIHTISRSVSKTIHPHIIFSAHDHDSVHITAPADDPWHKTIERLTEESPPWAYYPLSDNVIHELVVPTCSYRMGTPHMAYGLAIIDQTSNTMNYGLLWLPSRLLHLFIYLFCAIFISLVTFCWCLISCNRRLRVSTKSCINARMV